MISHKTHDKAEISSISCFAWTPNGTRSDNQNPQEKSQFCSGRQKCRLSSLPVAVDLGALPELDGGVPGAGGEDARAPVHARDGVAVRLQVVGGAAVLYAVGAQVVVLKTEENGIDG